MNWLRRGAASIKHTEVLNLAPRQFFMTTYSGIYRGITAEVATADLKVIFPEIRPQWDDYQDDYQEDRSGEEGREVG